MPVKTEKYAVQEDYHYALTDTKVWAVYVLYRGKPREMIATGFATYGDARKEMQRRIAEG